MKIVITGGAGMLGLNIANSTRSNEHDIVLVDNFSRYAGNPEEIERRMKLIARMGAGVIVHDISLRGVDDLVDIFKGADAVINAAADVGGVGYNRAHGPVIFARNAALQSLPVYAAIEAGVPRYMQISSVCVYTPMVGVPGAPPPSTWQFAHNERDQLGPVSYDNGGYAMSKRSGELLAMSSSIPCVTIIRPSNMFGPWDHYDRKAHVIPALINRVSMATGRVTVYSHPTIERDFLYVGQAADWIMQLMALPDEDINREVYNLPASRGCRVTMEELVETIIAEYDLTPWPVIDYEFDDAPTEVARRIDGLKLSRQLGGLDYLGAQNLAGYLAHTLRVEAETIG